MINKSFKTPRENISYILKKGDLYETGLFIVRFAKNDGHFLRYRVIISRKFSKSAVTRNKLRRRVYEIIRLNSPRTSPGHDLVLIPKKKTLNSTFKEIEADIRESVIKKHQ